MAKHSSGVFKRVDQVESGLACDCYCPDCGTALIAKKGDKVQHHFSHRASDADIVNFKSCGYDFWRSLHLLCFRALKDLGAFRMPTISVGYKETFLEEEYKEQNILVPGRMVKLDSVEYDYFTKDHRLKTIIARTGDFTFLICPLFSKEKDSTFNTYEYLARKGKGEIPVVLLDMESIKEDFYPSETSKFYKYVLKDAKRLWSSHGSKIQNRQKEIENKIKKEVEDKKQIYVELLHSIKERLDINDNKIYSQSIKNQSGNLPAIKTSHLEFREFDEVETRNGRHIIFKKREDSFNIYIVMSSDKIHPPKIFSKENDVCIWMTIPDSWRFNSEEYNPKSISYSYYDPQNST